VFNTANTTLFILWSLPLMLRFGPGGHISSQLQCTCYRKTEDAVWNKWWRCGIWW